MVHRWLFMVWTIGEPNLQCGGHRACARIEPDIGCCKNKPGVFPIPYFIPYSQLLSVSCEPVRTDNRFNHKRALLLKLNLVRHLVLATR